MDYGRWNEWDGYWTEGKKNETWSIKCGLKEMRWNMNNEINYVKFPGQPNLVVNSGVHPSLHKNCHHQMFCKLNLKIEYPPPYECF